MTRVSVVRRLAVAAVLLAACGGDNPNQPVAGDLTVTLATPGSSDGAVMIRVAGAIESVSAVGGYRVESSEISGGLTRIIVVGPVTSGAVARIRVPDINAVDQYVGLVEQVADRATFALLSTAGYSVSISK